MTNLKLTLLNTSTKSNRVQQLIFNTKTPKDLHISKKKRNFVALNQKQTD